LETPQVPVPSGYGTPAVPDTTLLPRATPDIRIQAQSCNGPAGYGNPCETSLITLPTTGVVLSEAQSTHFGFLFALALLI
jgi:hypothetical protein